MRANLVTVPGSGCVEFAVPEGLAKHAGGGGGFGLAGVNSTSVAQIESCAKCHARRGFVHPGHHAGSSFLDHFLPEVVQPWAPDMQVPTYYVDGQIDDEVYVYGSYVQSKMFHKGVKCVDCHDPHTVRVHAQGTNCACAAIRQRPKIRPFTILPPITFINPEAKELSAWNVICRRKPTWGLMPGGITVSGFLDLIFRSSLGCPMPVIVATKTKTRSGLQMRSLPERVPVAPKSSPPEAFHAFRSGKPNAQETSARSNP